MKFFVFAVNQNVFSSCHLHKRFQAVMCYDTAMPLASLSQKMCSHVICRKIQPFSFLPSRYTARSTAPKKQSCQGAQSCLKKYKHSRHFHQALEAAQIKGEHLSILKKSIHVSYSIPVRERSRGPKAWPRYESWNLKSDMLAPVWERSALASGLCWVQTLTTLDQIL